MKKYIQTREGAKKVGEMIADWKIGEFGFCVEIIETRTPQQNKALHVYFELLAEALNDAGLEIHMEFLGKSIEVPWCKDSVKKRIWSPPMETMFNKKHTSKLQRKEVGEIYDVLNRFFIEKHNLYIPFPEDKPPTHPGH